MDIVVRGVEIRRLDRNPLADLLLDELPRKICSAARAWVRSLQRPDLNGTEWGEARNKNTLQNALDTPGTEIPRVCDAGNIR